MVASHAHIARAFISSFTLRKSPSCCRLTVPARSDITSLKKSRTSASYLMVKRVPPLTRSNDLRNFNGRGPDTAFHAATWFGSYSITSYTVGICRQSNSLDKRIVEPVPREPPDVFLASTYSHCHFKSFSSLVKTPKTSSMGRLITVLNSNPSI